MTNNSNGTLPFLTVKIEEVGENDKTVAASRIALDVSNISPNSTKVLQKHIKQHTPEFNGIISTVEKVPSQKAMREMKEYSKALKSK